MSSPRQLLGSGCGFSHYVAPFAVMFQDGRVPLILSVVSNHSNPFLTFQVLSLAQLDCVQPNPLPSIVARNFLGRWRLKVSLLNSYHTWTEIFIPNVGMVYTFDKVEGTSFLLILSYPLKQTLT